MSSGEIILNFLKNNGVCDKESIVNGTELSIRTVDRQLSNLRRDKSIRTQDVLGPKGWIRSYFGLNGITINKECQYRNKTIYEEFCKKCKRYDRCF